MENEVAKPRPRGKFLEYLSAEILVSLLYPELEVLVFDKPDLRFPSFGVEHTIAGEICYCKTERAVNELTQGADAGKLGEETAQLIEKKNQPNLQLNYEITTSFQEICKILTVCIRRKNEKIEGYKHYNASVDLFVHLLYEPKSKSEQREIIALAQKERGRFRKIYILLKNNLVAAEKKRVTHHPFNADDYDRWSRMAVSAMLLPHNQF